MSNTALTYAAAGEQARSTPMAAWRPLAIVGATGPLAFLAVATLGGALTPDYNPLTDTISAIALGPVGGLQTANLYAFGASVIAFGLALRLRFASDANVEASLIHGLSFFGTCLPLPGAYALAALRLVDTAGWRRFATYTAALPSTVFFPVRPVRRAG
jgi:hypothetical protein